MAEQVVRCRRKETCARRRWVERCVSLHGLAFSPKSSGSPPKGTLLEHELAAWIDSPVVALSWPSESFGEFDKALIQGKVVPDRVLPALIGSPKEGKPLLKEVVYLVEGHSLGRGALDGHKYEGNVRIRRLLLSPHTCSRLLCCGHDLVFRVGLSGGVETGVIARRAVVCGAHGRHADG